MKINTFLPDPTGAGLHLGFKFSYVHSVVRLFVRLFVCMFSRLLKSKLGPYTLIKGQRDERTKGQRDKGTKGQWDKIIVNIQPTLV